MLVTYILAFVLWTIPVRKLCTMVYYSSYPKVCNSKNIRLTVSPISLRKRMKTIKWRNKIDLLENGDHIISDLVVGGGGFHLGSLWAWHNASSLMQSENNKDISLPVLYCTSKIYHHNKNIQIHSQGNLEDCIISVYLWLLTFKHQTCLYKHSINHTNIFRIPFFLKLIKSC